MIRKMYTFVMLYKAHLSPNLRIEKHPHVCREKVVELNTIFSSISQ